MKTCIVCQDSFSSRDLLSICVDPRNLSKSIKPSLICESCYERCEIGKLTKADKSPKDLVCKTCGKNLTTDNMVVVISDLGHGEKRTDHYCEACHKKLFGEKFGKIVGQSAYRHDDSLKPIDNARGEERRLVDGRRPETGFDLEIEALRTERQQLSERLNTPGVDRMAIQRRIGQIDDRISMLNALASPNFMDKGGRM